MKKTCWPCLLFRFPRIAGILFILFLSMFALDIFDMNLGFRGTIVGLFMHLIPTWILIIVLILSRKKYPLVGAIAFIGFGARYTVTNVIRFFMSTGTPGVQPPYYLLAWPLIIAVPPLLVGLAFLFGRLAKRKSKRK